MAVPAPIAYHELREFFDEDAFGQLCDIIVPGASVEAWSAALGVIHKNYPYRFTIGDEAQPIPEDATDILAAVVCEEDPWPSLGFDVGELFIRVMFYDEDWIEMDFVRAKMTPDLYEGVTELMCRLGDATGLDVFITPESDLEGAAMVYEASQRRFRRPRRSGDGGLRDHILGEVRDALRPFRDAPLHHPSHRDPVLDDAQLRRARKAIDSLLKQHTELSLQDVLSLDERKALQWTARTLWTIVDPTDDRARRVRADYERDLIGLARELC